MAAREGKGRGWKGAEEGEEEIMGEEVGEEERERERRRKETEESRTEVAALSLCLYESGTTLMRSLYA